MKINLLPQLFPGSIEARARQSGYVCSSCPSMFDSVN
jgi:hypothetical protein